MRLLLLSDTHLGFDMPLRPRVAMTRRGEDFFANTGAALAPARRGEIDAVIHGGDVFFRSKVPLPIVARGMALLQAAADGGAEVFIVAGNHERSAIPYPLLASHPRIHLIDRPRTFVVERRGRRLAIGGFPHVREVRRRFGEALAATGLREAHADARVLCVHQAVEGAKVGPVGFTFRDGNDVIRGAEVPGGIAAVLSGHIHRAQVLRRSLSGDALAAPVYDAGSIERTSFAEAAERKGYVTLAVEPDGEGCGTVRDARFHELPARPMIDAAIDARGRDDREVAACVRSRLEALPARSVVRPRSTARR
ncbi:MAG: metallophosphoesterase [Acidobacteriota bacterium]